MSTGSIRGESSGDRREPGSDGIRRADLLETRAAARFPSPEPVPEESSTTDTQLHIEGYEGLRELQRGGQGIVFQAEQRSTKRAVAIKVLREGPLATEAARRRFEREVEIVARLRHPHIVAIFDSGKTREGHLYYVMEFVRGQPLDEFVHDRKLSLEETLRLALPVLGAVGFAHGRGIIHRDLKPSNILVDGDGNPKVMDFGLARVLKTPVESAVSVTGQFVGTAAYMSPEQVRGHADEIDARTDVYALGVILYELLTGSLPYPVQGQLMEVMRNITETTPTPAAKAWDSATGITRRSAEKPARSLKCPIDDEVETVLQKALAKERDRRYASTEAFADDLSRYLAGQPILAKKDSRLYRLRKGLHRRWQPLVASLAVVLVLAALSFYAISRGPASEPIDETALAKFRSAEEEYTQVRRELLAAAGEGAELPVTDSVAGESLRIIQDAISELRAALDKNPNNLELRNLLLRTYQKEIDLLRRMSELTPKNAEPLTPANE